MAPRGGVSLALRDWVRGYLRAGCGELEAGDGAGGGLPCLYTEGSAPSAIRLRGGDDWGNFWRIDLLSKTTKVSRQEGTKTGDWRN